MKRSAKKVPPGPYTISSDSRMSEDFILTADILLDASTANPLAAVRSADGRWTPLAVIPGKGLVHVAQEQNSHSGWDLLPMPSGAAATEVVATLDGTGVSHAFFQDGTNTYHSALGDDGTWSVPDQLPPAASLAVANVPLTNEPVAIGITDGNLLFVRKNWSSGLWEGTPCDMQGALVGAQVVLSMIENHNWTLAAVAGGNLQFSPARTRPAAQAPSRCRRPTKSRASISPTSATARRW
jgi:hypothetical protein